MCKFFRNIIAGQRFCGCCAKCFDLIYPMIPSAVDTFVQVSPVSKTVTSVFCQYLRGSDSLMPPFLRSVLVFGFARAVVSHPQQS